MTTRRSALGKRGEQIAADHLRRRGYELVASNWRCRTGEFDLIARKDQTLVFVEVRTRREGSTPPSRASAAQAQFSNAPPTCIWTSTTLTPTGAST
ncbi:MAG: YraN family protein [Anaerolineae bacterium]